jgi:hypothetical protein
MPLNDDARQRNQRLPGQGGVFNPVNLGLFSYAANNPVKYVDPNGQSTYVDERGVVLLTDPADKDCGIYMQSSTEIQDYNKTKKVGETWFLDAFVKPETGEAEGRVYFGQNIDDYALDILDQARAMGTDRSFTDFLPGGKFDVKMQYPGHQGYSFHGFLFRGKYMTLRELGNFLAGANAAQHGMSFEDFQKGAGALHAGGTLGAARYRATGYTYGEPPRYGEIDEQYLRSKMGFEWWYNKLKQAAGDGRSR